MGWTMGMPSLKLNKTGLKSKHCGDFQSVAAEGLEERQGHDPDINPELAAKNIYEGIKTAAELVAYSDAHCEQLRDANGRALRKDAVRMCATIVKPPAAFMATLTEEDQKRFLQDSIDKVEEIVGRDNVNRVRPFGQLYCGIPTSVVIYSNLFAVNCFICSHSYVIFLTACKLFNSCFLC